MVQEMTHICLAIYEMSIVGNPLAASSNPIPIAVKLKIEPNKTALRPRQVAWILIEEHALEHETLHLFRAGLVADHKFLYEPDAQLAHLCVSYLEIHVTSAWLR